MSNPRKCVHLFFSILSSVTAGIIVMCVVTNLLSSWAPIKLCVVRKSNKNLLILSTHHTPLPPPHFTFPHCSVLTLVHHITSNLISVSKAFWFICEKSAKMWVISARPLLLIVFWICIPIPTTALYLEFANPDSLMITTHDSFNYGMKWDKSGRTL